MNNINKAAEIIKSGGVVIYPTDTAFGIGCRADDLGAVERVFKIRMRSEEKAVPVLFSSIDQVKEYVEPFDKKVEALMAKYWPGALTIVLSAKTDKLPSLVRGGGKTMGVRIPNHLELISVIKEVGVPIIGPSANFNGGATPFTYSDLDKSFTKLVDFVLEGETSGLGISSTVIDCTSENWKVLRSGGVKIEV